MRFLGQVFSVIIFPDQRQRRKKWENVLLQSFSIFWDPKRKHSSLHLLFDFLLKAQSETSYRLITGINDTGQQS